jgi:hypothetical protein
MSDLPCKMLTLVALSVLSLSTAYAQSPAVDHTTLAPVNPEENFRPPLFDPAPFPTEPAPIHSSTAFSHGTLTILSNPRNEQPWSQVITNQHDWKALFFTGIETMTFAQGSAPVAPTIDFDQYQILSGGLGVKSTGGYSLVVRKVRETQTQVMIDLLEISPAQGCLTFAALTYPSATIFIKKTDKPLSFTISQLTEACSDSLSFPQ